VDHLGDVSHPTAGHPAAPAAKGPFGPKWPDAPSAAGRHSQQRGPAWRPPMLSGGRLYPPIAEIGGSRIGSSPTATRWSVRHYYQIDLVGRSAPQHARKQRVDSSPTFLERLTPSGRGGPHARKFCPDPQARIAGWDSSYHQPRKVQFPRACTNARGPH
jgi:hypothetical protein